MAGVPSPTPKPSSLRRPQKKYSAPSHRRPGPNLDPDAFADMREPEEGEPYQPEPYESSRPEAGGNADSLSDLKTFISRQQNDLAKQRLNLINQEKHLTKLVSRDPTPEKAGAASDIPRPTGRKDGAKRRSVPNLCYGRKRNIMVNTGKSILEASSTCSSSVIHM